MPRSAKPLPDPGLTDISNEPKTKADLRREALGGIAQIGQFACLAFGQFSDAGAIGVFGPPIIDETVKLADNNSKIASKVDLLVEVGPYAGIVAATIPFLAQIFVNHGFIKPEMFANAGVMHPDMLETQMKTELMRKAMEAQQEQMRIQEEMEDMRRQYDAAQQNGSGEFDSNNVE